MNIYEKIQAVRTALKHKEIKMTGKNTFAGYDYFELDDFLTPLNELMQEHKMTAYPSFTEELATLTAVNCEAPEEKVTVTSPMGTANLKGCHEVQNIGAVETYQRRYLYQALFDITEKDGLNATQGKPEKDTEKEKPAAVNKPSDVFEMNGADKADNRTLFGNALKIAGKTPEQGAVLLRAIFGEEVKIKDLSNKELRQLIAELDKAVANGNH